MRTPCLNAGACRVGNETGPLVRVEDRRGRSHLTVAGRAIAPVIICRTALVGDKSRPGRRPWARWPGDGARPPWRCRAGDLPAAGRGARAGAPRTAGAPAASGAGGQAAPPAADRSTPRRGERWRASRRRRRRGVAPASCGAASPRTGLCSRPKPNIRVTRGNKHVRGLSASLPARALWPTRALSPHPRSDFLFLLPDRLGIDGGR